MHLETFVWRTCGECRAPVVRPLPEGWTYTIERRKSGIDWLFPHLPQCRFGFKKIEVGGDDD